MTKTPSIGRTVHVTVDPASNNGSDVAPAIITKVHENGHVNVRVFHDSPTSATVDGIHHVPLHEHEGEARAHVAEHIAGEQEKHKNEPDYVASLKHVNHAFWPHIEAPAEPAPAVDAPATEENDPF